MNALEQGLHHVAHLDEEQADLLVVGAALHVELHHDAKGTDGDCSASETTMPSNRMHRLNTYFR